MKKLICLTLVLLLALLSACGGGGDGLQYHGERQDLHRGHRGADRYLRG